MKAIYSCTGAMLAILAGAAFFPPDVMTAGPGSATSVKSVAVPAANAAQKMHLAENYGKLPLSFEANAGQTDGRVKFISRGRGYSLFLTGDEAVLELGRVSQNVNAKRGAGLPAASLDLVGRSASAGLKSGGTTAVDKPTIGNGKRITESVLRMKLVGANASATVTGVNELPGKSNYFIGNDPKKWRTNVPNYAKVKYQNVYPGVDLVYYGNQIGRLEYDFVVAAGADLRVITLNVAEELYRRSSSKNGGAKSPIQITANGDLVIKNDAGEVRFQKPVVYQPATDDALLNPDHRKRTPVHGQYILHAGRQVGFAVGPYDHTQPLIIDPVLSYSTYLGGSGSDSGTAIAVDASGNAYVTGYSYSTDFPTVNSLQATNHGIGDAL